MISDNSWVDIPNYEGCYMINKLGQIKSMPRVVDSRKRNSGVNTRTISLGHLRPELTKRGYLRVTLSNGGAKKRYLLHRLVASIFIPNTENKPQINHKDGNKENNCVENLEWVTSYENNKHAREFGLNNGRRGQFKYGGQLLQSILNRIESGETLRSISKHLTIPESSLSKIKNRNL